MLELCSKGFFFFQLFLLMARGEFGDTVGREENLQ